MQGSAINRRNFGRAYRKTMEQLRLDAEMCGVTLGRICAEAGVSNAFFRKTKDELPVAVETVVRVQDVVKAHLARLVLEKHNAARNAAAAQRRAARAK